MPARALGGAQADVQGDRGGRRRGRRGLRRDVFALPRPKRTHCDGCGEPLGDVDERCAGCRFTSYRSRKCYFKHWRAAHKVVCKAVGAAKFARVMACVDAKKSWAMFSIGIIYEFGTGVAKDAHEARPLLRARHWRCC